jgi:hypothetical protein
MTLKETNGGYSLLKGMKRIIEINKWLKVKGN